jgi:hypothetical protein
MSTYSTTLRLELIGAGQQDGTWGDTTNTNLGDLIEAAITNVVDITFANAQYTLSANNGLPDEARNAVLNLIGTNSGAQNLIAPAVEKTYIVKNATGATVTIKTSGGSGVAIVTGSTQIVWCDGTDFYSASVPYGLSTGTGNVVFSASPTLTGTPLAPTAAYGTNTTQIATTAFVQASVPAGVIVMWSGSIASVPSGWYLCNGSNGTPDLRDRFVVGAGSTYAVAATGGSANAITVAHTHTASSSSSVTDPGHYHTYQTGYNTNVTSYGSNGNFGGGTPDDTSFIYRSSTEFTGISVSTTTTVDSTGSSGTNANLPPYYALAYIMKA